MPQTPSKLQSASQRAQAGEAAERKKRLILGVSAGVVLLACGIYLTFAFKRALYGRTVVVEPSQEAIDAARPFAEDYTTLEAMSLPDLERELQSRQASAAAAVRTNPQKIGELEAAVDRCHEILSRKRLEASKADAGTK
ncbi:MAG: hypothetical protein GC200_01880 [Tepidisphaera sp.]|nr:hypothetical protein [Tepidisphaera sp.]